MVTTSCFTISFETADGPANMALDEAMLETVSSHPGTALFRTYGWSEPTLSLGYFQRTAQREAEPRWRSVAMVRRATGGGAIWHDHELTYSVALPVTHPRARPSERLYQTVHGAIASLLRSRGLAARSRAEAEAGTNVNTVDAGYGEKNSPFLCFSGNDPADIVSGGFKVVGSAQRRRAGAVLQHGSILLGGSERVPELRGIGDLIEVPTAPRDWAGEVEQVVLESLGLDPVPLPVVNRAAMRARAEEIERAIYRNDAWTHRR